MNGRGKRHMKRRHAEKEAEFRLKFRDQRSLAAIGQHGGLVERVQCGIKKSDLVFSSIL
jgi:hypothetical protein